MIIRYRCDRSMAIKKRVIFTCDRKCQNCLCALAKDEYGHEHHVGQSSGGVCGNITRRNFEVMNHDGQVAADRFDRQRDDRHKVDWRFDGRRNR